MIRGTIVTTKYLSHRAHGARGLGLHGRNLLASALLAASAGAAAGPTIDFGEQGSLIIGYSLQAWAQNSNYTSPKHSGESTDFFLRRNRLTFSGNYNDGIGFYVQLEAGNDSKDSVDDKGIYYRDAYVTIDHSDQVRFIVGRFKNTFSRENLEACLEPLTLDRGDASYTPFGGTRDSGAAVWGNLADGHLQYRVMFADGREGDYVPKDNARVTVRGHWSLFEPEYDYGYRGTYLGTKKVLTLGAAFDYQPDAAYASWASREGSQDYQAGTVDAFLELPTRSGTYTVSAAWLDYGLGNAVNNAPDPELPITTEQDAWYVKAGYLLPEKVGAGRLQFFGRHDVQEFNLDSGLFDKTYSAAGAHYYLHGQQIKLTLEHGVIEYETPVAGNPALEDGHQTTLGFQFIL